VVNNIFYHYDLNLNSNRDNWDKDSGPKGFVKIDWSQSLNLSYLVTIKIVTILMDFYFYFIFFIFPRCWGPWGPNSYSISNEISTSWKYEDKIVKNLLKMTSTINNRDHIIFHINKILSLWNIMWVLQFELKHVKIDHTSLTRSIFTHPSPLDMRCG